MGRKHPPRWRRVGRPPAASIPGLPRSTSEALDRLDRVDVGSHKVRWALQAWDHYTRIPRGPRRLEKDPSDEDSGARARTTLDAATAALARRRARPLRRIIERMDRRFLDTTVPDPSTDRARPWWQRRDWF